jgi:UDP-glucose 4-epimerase
VEALISKDYDVYVIDDHSSHNPASINAKADNKELNICDFDEVDKYFRANIPFDYIFHLAAESNMAKCIDNPLKTQVVNVMGTANLLQYAKISEVKRFVFASTSAVYGIANAPPFNEDMSPDHLNPYSVSKSSAEAQCEMFHRLFHLPTVCLRLFNVYGDGLLGEGDFAPFIPRMLRQHKEGEKYSIYGDGSQTRDFVHVDDVVQAMIMAAESDNDQIFGEVLNVGSGVGYSLMDVIDMIAGEGRKRYHYYPARIGESTKSCADTNKIKKMLGWKPSKCLKEYIVQKNS